MQISGIGQGTQNVMMESTQRTSNQLQQGGQREQPQPVKRMIPQQDTVTISQAGKQAFAGMTGKTSVVD